VSRERFPTNYPDRYRKDDTSPAFADYVPQKHRPMGKSCEGVLPGTEGTIVASVKNGYDNEYFVDQDFVLWDVREQFDGLVYLIWSRDSWRRITPEPLTGSGFREASSVWPEESAS
jgi:hypothetical protein